MLPNVDPTECLESTSICLQYNLLHEILVRTVKYIFSVDIFWCFNSANFFAKVKLCVTLKVYEILF